LSQRKKAIAALRVEEADLLQGLLSQLTNEQAFMVGEIMGIMRKGDDDELNRMRSRILNLEQTIEQHEMANEEAERGDQGGHDA